jgi:hypothetical protein
MKSTARLPVRGIVVSALCALLAGCSMGSRRILPGDYPFDPRLDCLFDDRHVMLFLIDGCRADLLYEMARAGELPVIRKYFIDRGVSSDCAMSTVPSITNAAVAALTCGVYPGRLNVIGNRWFDQELLERASVFGLNDYYRTESFLDRPTIYEMLGDELTVSLVTRCPRGSTYHIPFYYNLIGMKYYLMGNWGRVDEAFLGEFDDVAACANREGVFPSFVFFHLTGYDTLAHREGPFSPGAKGLLKNIDRALGPIMECLDRNGALDRVCLMLTADHGQVPLKKGNCLLWEEWFPARTGLPALDCFNRLDRASDALAREHYYDRYAVIVANNGRNAFLHFRHNPAGRWVPPDRMASWETRPSWDELRSYQAPRGPVDLVEELKGVPGVGCVIGKPREGEIALFTAAGESRIRTAPVGGETRFAYELVSGRDPLGYREAPESAALMDGGYHSSREWLNATCGLAQPDIVAQLPSLFESTCRGDLYVIAGDTWDFEKVNVSGHGGFLRGEMRIPLVIAGPGIRKGTFGPVRIVDIAPTVLEYAGHGDRIGGYGMDGVTFLKEIAAP